MPDNQEPLNQESGEQEPAELEAQVTYEKLPSGIAVLTLDHPGALNAFSVKMRDDAFEALSAIRDDDEVRGVIVRGAGDRAFCAGAYLPEFGTTPSQAVARSVRWERDLWGLWLSINKPMVAAINGYCLGSGIEIASVCDVRIAAKSAVFGMPEVGLGLIPAAGGTQLLPRLLGQGRALDLLLTGRRFTADDAWQYGLVSEVVSRDMLYQRAEQLMQTILAASSESLAAAKRAVCEGLDLSLPEALALERRVGTALAQGA
jgi:enoyl-CoA hydratase/carnithine racemase